MTTPVTLVSGYLGAGKTTLINRMLENTAGLKLTVLVNDFGEINIDAALIQSRTADTLALTNGCACCALNDDLSQAFATAIETSPDCIVMEGSGVANLARLKRAANGYPGLRLSAAITLVDASSINGQLANKFIGQTVAEQINSADKLIITREGSLPDIVTAKPRLVEDELLKDLALQLLLAPDDSGEITSATHNMPDYVRGYFENASVSRDQLVQLLDNAKTAGLLRLKGVFADTDTGQMCFVQWSWGNTEITHIEHLHPQQLVFIGLPGFDETFFDGRVTIDGRGGDLEGALDDALDDALNDKMENNNHA